MLEPIERDRLRHAARASPPTEVTLEIDGQRGHRAGRHLADARRHRGRHRRCPSCAPPTASSPSARAGCAWSRSRAGAGYPASCTTPAEPGMKVRTQSSEAAASCASGVMELYISDHPLDCLTCAANGDCELQDMARRGRPAQRALRLRRRQPPRTRRRTNRTPTSPTTRAKCIVCNRCVRACEETQGTFALTISGRGFDSRVSRRAGRGLHGQRVRELRRLRAGLPDRDAAGEDA